jgi:hypothetical protein
MSDAQNSFGDHVGRDLLPAPGAHRCKLNSAKPPSPNLFLFAPSGATDASAIKFQMGYIFKESDCAIY